MTTINNMAGSPAYQEAFDNAHRGPVFMGPFNEPPIEGWVNDLDQNGVDSDYFGRIFRQQTEGAFDVEENRQFWAGAIAAGRSFIMVSNISDYDGLAGTSYSVQELFWLEDCGYTFDPDPNNNLRTLITPPPGGVDMNQELEDYYYEEPEDEQLEELRDRIDALIVEIQEKRNNLNNANDDDDNDHDNDDDDNDHDNDDDDNDNDNDDNDEHDGDNQEEQGSKKRGRGDDDGEHSDTEKNESNKKSKVESVDNTSSTDTSASFPSAISIGQKEPSFLDKAAAFFTNLISNPESKPEASRIELATTLKFQPPLPRYIAPDPNAKMHAATIEAYRQRTNTPDLEDTSANSAENISSSPPRPNGPS